MHEMSLCESLLQVMEDAARTQGFQRVKAVYLEIGSLSGVEIEAMRFCFDVVVKDSLAEDARLEIAEIPAQAWCMICAKTLEVRNRYDACPDCGQYQLQISGGEEMRIKELEVE